MLREKIKIGIHRQVLWFVIPRYGTSSECGKSSTAIDPGQRIDGLRETSSLEVFGPDYIGRALTQARAFAPKAHLIVNGIRARVRPCPSERDRRYFLLKLLDG